MTKLRKILICGSGLAAQMTALALAQSLPKEVELILVGTRTSPTSDIFYGTVTPASTYTFLLNMGVSEPDLLKQTDTTFSFGTHYKNWGPDRRSWIQCFHRPLSVFAGVEFQHYLTRYYEGALNTLDTVNLEPFLISALAAQHGHFAHPPEGKAVPLARAEYGYHFSPQSWTVFFKKLLGNTRVKQVHLDRFHIQTNGQYLSGVTANDGTLLTADLFIDCMGPKAELLSQLAPQFTGERDVSACVTHTTQTKISGSSRALTMIETGWQSVTPLQNGLSEMSLSASGETQTLSENTDLFFTGTLGRRESVWEGNCVAVGHSGAILDPLSPAPMILLQNDIERLLEVIPTSQDMNVERAEYNRRFSKDYAHIERFHRALFISENTEDTPYWRLANTAPICKKLQTKLTQFQSRGILVQYDYEPFSPQDWVQLHFGMGRRPKRYDRLADRMNADQLDKILKQMQGAIGAMASKMPPQQIYMARLLKYLEEKHG